MHFLKRVEKLMVLTESAPQYIDEEFGSKTLYFHFCVFEKNTFKVWNLLGNALENFDPTS
jgi:hypothetical protein